MGASSEISMKRLQVADRFLGAAVLGPLQPLRWLRRLRRPRRPVQRVLLIKFWGMGSLQLLTPAVRALRVKHPGARLTLLTLQQNREFAEGLGVFDEVIAFRVTGAGWTRLYLRILGLLLGLRRGRYDRVFDFEFFTRFSAVVSMLSGAPETFGFSAPSVWRGGLHTRSVPFNRYWHVARNFRCLVGGENGEEVRAAELAGFRVLPEHHREVDEVLERRGLADGGPLVVLNPNAGALSLERRWPQTAFAELGRRLQRESGARIVLIGAPSEVEWTADVEALLGGELPGRLANTAGELSIGGLHALLARADAFVSNDSGPMHVAAALGTPTVGLFGPETPVMYRPLGTRAVALYKPPACSPCINVHENKYAVCYRGRPDCLIGITVDEVLAAATGLLAEEPPRRLPVRRPAAPGAAVQGAAVQGHAGRDSAAERAEADA